MIVEPKKQPKAMYYLPGIIVLCLGMAMMGMDTPDRTVRFGADFYTECYQAIAEVAYLIKTGMGLLLFAVGTISLCKGIAEAKRADLVLERLDALREAVLEKEDGKASDSPIADDSTPEGPLSPEVKEEAEEAVATEAEAVATEAEEPTEAEVPAPAPSEVEVPEEA